MKNLVDALDWIKKACDSEIQLRSLVDLELSRGEENGPMKNAHDSQILEVIQAAKNLVELSEK
jgi:hypothetical protein